MIHDGGFLAWHQHFVAELETWLVNNGGSQFVPVPYWDPSRPIPAQLDKNNNSVNMPLPQNLRPAALKKISSYTVLDHRIVPYHGSVHDALGGQMQSGHLAVRSHLLAVPCVSGFGLRTLAEQLSAGRNSCLLYSSDTRRLKQRSEASASQALNNACCHYPRPACTVGSTSERNTSSICAGVNRLRRSIHHIRTAKKAAVR